MKIPTIAVALSLTLAAAPAAAQVKSWVDENGVTHFEAKGGGTAPQSRNGAPLFPGRTSVAIDRSHAGLSLGDTDSSLRNPNLWRHIGTDKFGGASFTPFKLPTGAVKMTVSSYDYRVFFIEVTYSNTWQSLVDATAKKYGPATLTGSTATWTDAQTGLILTNNFSAGVVALLVDRPGIDAYSARAGRDAPKF